MAWSLYIKGPKHFSFFFSVHVCVILHKKVAHTVRCGVSVVVEGQSGPLILLSLYNPETEVRKENIRMASDSDIHLNHD